MWNVKKIGKSIHHLMTTYGEGNDLAPMDNDLIGESRIDHVVNLYREMNFPFGAIMMMKNRTTEMGRNVLWGRKWNERNYCETVVIPKLSDHKYLASLKPNTVGAHYYNTFKKFGIEDLYNQRFKKEEIREGGKLNAAYNSFSDDIRENASRHLLLSHDLWHIIFRYDTTPMGEAMIQTVTARIFNWWTPNLVGFFGSWKMARATKSRLPWKVLRECYKLSKQVDKTIALYSPLDFLEQDIEEVRKKFNIFVPLEYKKFTKQFSDFSKMDTIHPNYNDKIWNEAEVI
tara:strand:- start:4631 stop:5491 length:861 start_codon:yes stop_codon:yes gene_type:complete